MLRTISTQGRINLRPVERTQRENPIGALAWREAVGPRKDSKFVSIHSRSVSTLFISISLYSSLFISIYLYLSLFTFYLVS